MKKRIKNDFYPTPERLIDVLQKHNFIPPLSRILEPCCGDNAIAEALYRYENSNYDITATDITQGDEFDATTDSYWTRAYGGFDWIVTNPPFSTAHLIVPKAFKCARFGIAMLLRLTWLEPCNNRREFLQENRSHLSHLIILNPRPQFRSDTRGTDSVTCAWMIWQHGHDGGTSVRYCTDWR